MYMYVHWPTLYMYLFATVADYIQFDSLTCLCYTLLYAIYGCIIHKPKLKYLCTIAKHFVMFIYVVELLQPVDEVNR